MVADHLMQKDNPTLLERYKDMRGGENSLVHVFFTLALGLLSHLAAVAPLWTIRRKGRSL